MNTTEQQGAKQTTTNGSGGRLRTVFRKGGAYYGTVYISRWLVRQVLDFLDRRLIGVEQRRGLTDQWTILANRLTAGENRKIWNEYDWSKHGEEWTRSEEWRTQLIREYIEPHFPNGSAIVEIGPGGGRWSDVLRKRAEQLTLVDVAEKPLELCRERFKDCTNIQYLQSDGRSLPVADNSVDRIWSYECFVHINPLDIKGYFHEFRRVLKPGGLALIHHAGPPVPGVPYRPGMRSDMTDKMAYEFAQECGLTVEAQTSTLVNPGDVLTMLRRPE